MERAPLSGLQIRPATQFPNLGRWVRGALFIVFTLTAILAAVRIWAPGIGALKELTPESLVLVMGLLSTMGALTRQLPLQNVVLAAVVVFVVVLGAILLNASTGLPFGGWTGDDAQHQRLLCIWPAIWVTFLLAARGVAALVVRPWRHTANYGHRVLILTAILAVSFELSLEPFATTVNQFWSWNPSRLPLAWYGTPLLTLWGWAVTAFIAAALITPILIQKTPSPKATSMLLFWTWLVLKALFLAGTIHAHLWMVSGFILVEVVVVWTWLFTIRAQKRS